MSKSKEDYFNQGRSDRMAGGYPQDYKEGTWQFRAYWEGWDSYVAAAARAPARPNAPILTSADRVRQSLMRRAEALQLKVERRARGTHWIRGSIYA